eukprot:m.247773 g.247773  ORF g.247773 m.247773 type:complete len:56 (+) comp17492_c0_seq1:6191-6358(+)
MLRDNHRHTRLTSSHSNQGSTKMVGRNFLLQGSHKGPKAKIIHDEQRMIDHLIVC